MSPLDRKFRGIVMPANFELRPGGGLSVQGQDRGEVLFNAVYWDKIFRPQNRLVHMSFDGENELIQEGVIDGSLIEANFSSGTAGQFAIAVVQSQLAEYERLNAGMPGQWAMGQTPLARFVSAKEFVEDRGLLVELYGALPAPHPETPVDRILEYKRKRKPELERLRAALEGIYLTVSDTVDQEVALNKAVAEIDKACSDLMKSSKEVWRAAVPADLKSVAEYSLTLSAPFIVLAGLNITLPQTAAATALGAVLKIARDVGKKRKSDQSNPYWFAVDLKRQGLA